MAFVSRDSILNTVAPLGTRDVEVPEWGGTVRVKELTAAERDQFEANLPRDKAGMALNTRASFVVACAVDENGNRLFQDVDAVELGKQSGRSIDRVFGVAKKINGLTDDDIEELEKN